MESRHHLDQLIDLAIAEDEGPGDVTTAATVPPEARGQARIVAKGPLVLAGREVAERVYARVDARVEVRFANDDGAALPGGALIAELSGPLRGILRGERCALNFLMRLSGIATGVRRLRDLIADHPDVALLDTRKTTPGHRGLEKAAVRAGGGRNHRFGLFDGILIKENHIRAAGSVGEAVTRARRGAHHLLRIQCEVTTPEEVEAALAAGADALLLDNMDAGALRRAVTLARSRQPGVFLEASGNMTAERLPRVAATGVDAISIGAVTHSAQAADISLLVEVRRSGGALGGEVVA